MKNLLIGLGCVAVLAMLVGAGLYADNQRKEHERFLHFTWEAAYHQARSQQEAQNLNIPVWATLYEDRNGCKSRRLWIRNDGGLPGLLSSDTVNMWGYEPYGGWEFWTKPSDEVMGVLKAYVAGLDSATAAYAAGWMKSHVD